MTHCYKCAGEGWAGDGYGTCEPCGGTGRKDGQLSPHEVITLARIRRLERRRVDAGLTLALLALLAAAAVVFQVLTGGA